MAEMRNIRIMWDELIEAFEDSDGRTIYFLDRETGEIFPVPEQYPDEGLWNELEREERRYLRIPEVDRDGERFLLYSFIRGIEDARLRRMLEDTFLGLKAFGKIDEILAFYPEEQDRLAELREDVIAGRIRSWLEENDLLPLSDPR